MPMKDPICHYVMDRQSEGEMELKELLKINSNELPMQENESKRVLHSQ